MIARHARKVTTVRFIIQELLKLFEKHTAIEQRCVEKQIEPQAKKLSLIENMLQWKTDVYSKENARYQVPPNSFPDTCQKELCSEKNISSDNESRDILCGICYQTIQLHECAITRCESDGDWQIVDTANDCEEGKASFGMALKPCKHWFCEECWRFHLLSKIRQGDLLLECPAFKCTNSLDKVTLLAVLSYQLYEKYCVRIHEFKLERSPNWQWCPNKRCKAIARAFTGKQGDPSGKFVCIDCKCRTVWCFDCQSEAHWPMSCRSYTPYQQYIENTYKVKPDVIVVQVKKCPKCKYPINKNGGCSSMYCTMCQCSFCWECLKPWSEHVRNGLVCASHVLETNWAISSEESLRLDERMHLLASKFREQRLECIPHKFMSEFSQQAFKFMIAKSRNLSTKRRRFSKYQPTLFLKSIIDDKLNIEQAMVIEIGEFLYQAYHVLEFSYAALSPFPRRQLNRMMMKLDQFAFVINNMKRTLLGSSSKISLEVKIRQIYDKMQKARGLFENVSKLICKYQKEMEASQH